VGTIGNDIEGKFLKNSLKRKGVNVEGIISINSNTTIKNRILVDHHTLARFDKENIHELSHTDQNKLLRYIKKISNKIQCIIVSDYDKGIVNIHLLDYLKKISLQNKIPFIVDPKKKNHHLKYGNQCIIKTNYQNAKFVASKFSSLKSYNDDFLLKFLKKTNQCKSVIITKGKDGVVALDDNKIYRITNSEKNVYDVTGAGDVVLAVFSYCLILGYSFESCCKIANLAAGIKVGKVGTYAITKKELEGIIDNERKNS
jgi:D-beta-D-heptose 7-phosphate kinase/D-beta-D-heptose 1-phosphate adenosyltransferase